MRIAVYGASGHTGRFVVAELLRRGHTPVAMGRTEANVAAAAATHRVVVETRTARLDEPASLERALRDVVAVINCAGPFLDTASPVIAAALRSRVHYLDVTAEQASARSTLAEFDAPGRDRGVLVVPAAGFFGGLGDLVATYAMNGWTSADRIEIGIALDRWWPTQGTRRTGERNTATRVTLCAGSLAPLRPSQPKPWTFPDPFGIQRVVEVPLSETILMARHLRVHEIHNFMNEAPLRDLGDERTPEPVATDERGRSNQRFVLEAVVSKGAEERRVAAEGRDIYATTAPLVVEAVERACAGLHRAGAFALAELVDVPDVVRSLERSGDISFTWRSPQHATSSRAV